MTEETRLRRPVTSFDVAKRAGVSRSTVSIVINNTPGVVISDKTRQAVWDAVRELNYHPNTIARSMRSSRSNMLGLVVGIHPTSQFLSHLLAGIQETAANSNYCVVLAGTGLDEKKMDYYASLYLRKQVDGLIVALYTSRTDYSFLGPVKATGAPIVVVNSGFEDADVGHIHFDYEQGAREATTHLISLGHKKIVLLGMPADEIGVTKALALRRKGYVDSMNDAGLEPMILTNPENHRRPNRHCGYETGKQLLQSDAFCDVTACYCLSDWAAVGLMDAARELGVSLPQRLAIIGNDDLPGAQFTVPSLSTVARPNFDAGRAAVEVLVNRIENSSEVDGEGRREAILPCRLVIRESCGARLHVSDVV